MNCHYSCASCTIPTYMNYCTLCPQTRQLIQSTCRCIKGYYEAQQPLCYPTSQASFLIHTLLPFADFLFYLNIALFWSYIILILCRVNSQSMRIVINFGQVIALVLYYPFLLDEVSSNFIWAISALNFTYTHFNNACIQYSIACTMFQFIWEPLLILPGIVICFFIAFVIMNSCYKIQLDHPISLRHFWQFHRFLLIYIFIDLTAVIYSYNMTKATLLTNWGLVQTLVYLVIVGFVIWKYFKIINSPEQSKAVYRAKNDWAFGYDEYYHLHFIDFLYNEGRKLNKNQLQIQQQNCDVKVQSNQQIIKRFTPHSNLYIFQLLFKILAGSTTALLYWYKPMLIVFPLVLLIAITLCWIGTFAYYNKVTFALYILSLLCVLLCGIFYWLSGFWVLSIIISILTTIILLVGLSSILCRRIKMSDRQINKIMSIKGQQQQKNDQNTSQQQFIKIKQKPEDIIQQGSSKFQSHQQKQNKSKSISSVQNQSKWKNGVPFNGILENNQSGRPQSLLGRNRKEDKPKTKEICIEATNQGAKNSIIKHSQYQSKINTIKQRVRTKNSDRSDQQKFEPSPRQPSPRQPQQKIKQLIYQNKYKLQSQLSYIPQNNDKLNSQLANKNKSKFSEFRQIGEPNSPKSSKR